jgi:hypothetical protein
MKDRHSGKGGKDGRDEQHIRYAGAVVPREGSAPHLKVRQWRSISRRAIIPYVGGVPHGRANELQGGSRDNINKRKRWIGGEEVFQADTQNAQDFFHVSRPGRLNR